jgi:hypothetical protein
MSTDASMQMERLQDGIAGMAWPEAVGVSEKCQE